MQTQTTKEEVKQALYLMEANKAPGPNGFQANFFEKNWNIMGKDVSYAVKELLKK